MIFPKTRLLIYLFFIFNFFILKNSFALDSLSYSGRLVNANGSPVTGQVTIRARLAYTNDLSNINTFCTQDLSNVDLTNGVFHVKFDFVCKISGSTVSLTQFLSQTPDGESVAIQITDMTHSKSYSFQALHALPFANVASQLAQNGAGDGEFLKWSDSAKGWVPGTVSGASGGTVTSVSVNAPLTIATPTSTPSISLPQATGAQSGYLSSADWNTFNNKEGTLTGGTTAQYYRGDKSWQTLDSSVVPENVNLYFTNARALGVPLTGFSATSSAIVATDTALQAFGKAQGQINTITSDATHFLKKDAADTLSSNVTLSGSISSTLTGDIIVATTPLGVTSAVNKGYVDSGDALKISKNGDTMSGVLTLDSDLKIKGGSNYVTVKGHAASAAYNLFLPQTAGTAGYVLATDGSGNLSWANPSSTAMGSGTVNSASITDGSIVDADINASAAIAQSKIAGLTTDLSNKQPLITAGTTAQYYRGDKTFVDLGTDVRNTALTGFTVGANSAIIATDSTLNAFQKVQGQIDATNTAVAGKEPSLAAGSVSQYYRGDKTWQTLNGTSVANTAAGTITATNVQAALNELDSEKQTNITSASAITSGSVTTSLQNGVNVNPFGAAVGNTGELRFYELAASGSNYTSLKAPDTLVADINYVLPSTAPTAGQVLSSNASGVMSWATLPSAPVSTVFGRSGIVTATGGDYTASQITNTPAGSIAATNVQAALNELDTEKEPVLTNPNDTTKYYRGDKTWSTFATDTINSVLSTFSLNAGAKPAVTNTDTVVGAFGKVQKYLNDVNADYVSKSANNTVTGSFNISGITSFIQVPTPSGAVVNEAANVQYVQNYVGGFGQWTKGSGANAADLYFNTGNIGIGTTTPNSKLSVTDSLAITNTAGIQYLLMGNQDSSGTNHPGIIRAANGNIEIGSGSSWTGTGGTFTPKVFFGDNGNVGIGTTSPQVDLHILSTQPATAVHPDRAGLIVESEGTNVGGRVALKVFSDVENPIFVGYRARGTKAAPTALLSNDIITSLAPVGYDGAGGWQTSPNLLFRTTENWSATALGSAIFFRTAANGTTASVDRMKIDQNGYVGVGTATPSHLLHVSSSSSNGGLAVNAATGNNAYIDFQEAGTKKANIYLKGADDTLQINDLGTTNTVINGSGGNVGIGTSAPSTRLHISKSVSGEATTVDEIALRISNPIQAYGTGGEYAQTGISFGRDDNIRGGIVYGTYGLDYMDFYTADSALATPRMRITATGNVGIGTTTPSTALEVNGTVKATAFQSATGQALKMMAGTATYSTGACAVIAGCMTFNVNFGYTFSSPPIVTLTGATNGSWCNLMKLDVSSTSTTGITVAVTNPTSNVLTASNCTVNWQAMGN